jgi:hypothetical protein
MTVTATSSSGIATTVGTMMTTTVGAIVDGDTTITAGTSAGISMPDTTTTRAKTKTDRRCHPQVTGFNNKALAPARASFLYGSVKLSRLVLRALNTS